METILAELGIPSNDDHPPRVEFTDAQMAALIHHTAYNRNYEELFGMTLRDWFSTRSPTYIGISCRDLSKKHCVG